MANDEDRHIPLETTMRADNGDEEEQEKCGGGEGTSRRWEAACKSLVDRTSKIWIAVVGPRRGWE
jgi:hypothetical protein